MLSARNIYKRYGPVEVLKGVDIDIQKGEIVSIVGPSGSGKSTLLHILGTLDAADSGTVEISGVRIDSRPPVAATPAVWWKRLLHWLIDGLLIGALAAPLIQLLQLPGEAAFPQSGLDWSQQLARAGIITLVAIVYYSLWEWLAGRTPAKWLTGCRIFRAHDYARPGAGSIFWRTLSRFIPFEPFSLIQNRPRGWHDSISSTFVSDSKIQYGERNELSPDALALLRNRRIGFVFQFHHLLPEFTALENVCIAGWLNDDKKEVKTRAIQLLKALGMEHRMHNKPAQLSGGEQQRVAVARALINKPDIVFADEPTGNLDTANARELHQLFFDLRRDFGQTFLIVTHNEELARISDRMLTMKDGKMEMG